MKKIYAHDQARFQTSAERIRNAYLHQPVDWPPVIIGDVNYSVCCEAPSLIPDDYFTNCRLSLFRLGFMVGTLRGGP